MSQQRLHLAEEPGESRYTFPECLRPEVEALASHLWEARLYHGEPEDAWSDWMDAEDELLSRCFDSPARLMPGGDLFHAFE
jgi:hypothetical protein